MKEKKPIGEVTHYYSGIGVAIVKFNKNVKVGDKVAFKGTNTDFAQSILSMQYEHEEVKSAKKNQLIGVKVEERVREGDKVFPV